MQKKTRQIGRGSRSRRPGGWRRLLLVAVAASLAGMGCGGSDGGPTDPPNNPPNNPPPPAGTSIFSGAWDTTDLDEVGTPSSRYVITQNGGTLTGDAYWRWRGVLERIGPITGTIAANGSFEWTAVMNDNGWDGTETVTGTFTGSASSVSGFATLASAGTPIQWKWFAPDGSLREEGDTQIENPPIIIPTHGEGPVGEAGLWRGTILFSSPGNCNAQGFSVTMGLDGAQGMWDDHPGDDDGFVGNLSARRMAYDEVVNLSAANNFADFLGPIGGFIEGRVQLQPIDQTLPLSVRVVDGPLSGHFIGFITQNPATPARLTGEFELDQAGCIDNFGSHNNGLFILLSERQLSP